MAEDLSRDQADNNSSKRQKLDVIKSDAPAPQLVAGKGGKDEAAPEEKDAVNRADNNQDAVDEKDATATGVEDDDPDWSVVNAEETEAKAMVAATRAAKGAKSEEDVLNALEKAEEQFEAQNPPEPEVGSPRAVQMLNHLDRVGSGVNTTHRGQQRNDKASTSGIDDKLRERCRERIFNALKTNPTLQDTSEQEVLEHSTSLEEDCYQSCHQRQVYIAKISNASRLAKKISDASELLRIASGLSKATPEDQMNKSTDQISGLIGSVIKPR